MKGFTVWFTGLSGSGKTTLSSAVSARLRERGLPVEVLDGDVVRENLCNRLGFSKEDRDENIRRIGFVCHLLSRNKVIAMAAAIAPYEKPRQDNRKLIGRYVEVYCRCPLEALIQRDPKGLYQRALAGEIKNFTGVDDPYEEPQNPDLVVDTDKESPQESVERVMTVLEPFLND